MERVEIKPASLEQVRRTRTGRLVAIDADVQNVAEDLKRIDEGLVLEFDPGEEIFVVTHRRVMPDGSVEEHLVTTAQECDQRIVRRIEQISAPGYSYADELERLDRLADRERDRRFSEQVGPIAERLQHALRKDLGLKGGRAFVPGGRRGSA